MCDNGIIAHLYIWWAHDPFLFAMGFAGSAFWMMLGLAFLCAPVGAAGYGIFKVWQWRRQIVADRRNVVRIGRGDRYYAEPR